ncbi:hypothetical protein ACLB1Q_13435 [Escherichia coli]
MLYAGDLCRPCRLWLLDERANNVRDGARHGLLVDDAIVVVENVERVMAKRVPPKEATR